MLLKDYLYWYRSRDIVSMFVNEVAKAEYGIRCQMMVLQNKKKPFNLTNIKILLNFYVSWVIVISPSNLITL